MTETIFKLKRPCAKCPFRTDVPPYLHPDRAAEIAYSIAEGAIFPCHQTTEYDEEENDLTATANSQFCAGALIVMEHMDVDNQATRMAERLKLYDNSQLDMSAPVAHSWVEFIDHHGQDEPEPDVCAISNSGCSAPAGYMINGHVVRGQSLDYELAQCPACGDSVCDSCMAEGGLCPYCTEEEEEED